MANSVPSNEISQNTYHIKIAHEIIPEININFKIPDDLLINRFQNGDVCFLLGSNEAVLGMLWGHRGKCYIRGAGKNLEINDDTIYLYNVFTMPKDRENKVFTTLLNAFFKYYSEKGVKRYCSLVAPGNTTMLSILNKNGFIIKSNIHYVKLLNFRILL